MSQSDFSGRAQSVNGPARRILGIVPSDESDLPEGLARGLFVGGAGTVRMVDDSGNVTDILSAAHQYHPLRARRIMATGTTATDIVALY